MRDSKKKEKKRGPLSKFARIWGMGIFLLTVAFLGVTVYLNILPIKLLLILVAVIILISLIILPPLLSFKFKNSRRVIAFFLSILVGAVYGVGIVYMTGTLSFFNNISSLNHTTEEFSVVVMADSEYKGLDDLNNAAIAILDDEHVPYDEAGEILEKDYGARTFLEYELPHAEDLLYSGEYDGLLLSPNDLKVAGEIAPDFPDRTRIIGTIKVNKQAEDIAKRVDVNQESYNVFISGIDVRGPISTQSRSDVNMIVTVNPKTKKILLTSIPRDYKIRLVNMGYAEDKITHAGIYGIDDSVLAAEDLLDIDINYYVKVNFSTVTEFVDAIGGIDVESDQDLFIDGTVQTQIKKGTNHLNGEQALDFARERNSYEDGDIQRNKNQQQVLANIIRQATSSKTILIKYYKILNGLDDYIETNMEANEMQALLRGQLLSLKDWEIETQNLEGFDNSGPLYSTGGEYAYVMEPDEAKIDEIRNRIIEVMNE